MSADSLIEPWALPDLSPEDRISRLLQRQGELQTRVLHLEKENAQLRAGRSKYSGW